MKYKICLPWNFFNLRALVQPRPQGLFPGSGRQAGEKTLGTRLALVRNLASPFGHPTQVSAQVQLDATQLPLLVSLFSQGLIPWVAN